MDIKEGYGVDFINKAQRNFAFENGKITLTDSFDFTKEVQITERFVSLTEPKTEESVVKIDDVTLINNKNAVPQITVKEVKAHLQGTHNVYIIDYILQKGETEFTIEFRM